MKICSPIPKGSGLSIVHKALAKSLKNYTLCEYNPRHEYLPFLIRKFSDRHANIIHTSPDYAFLHARKNQALVVTLHGYMLDSYIQSYSTLVQRVHYKTDLRLFTKLSLKRATVVTAVSQFLADKVRDDLGFTGPIDIIPNGVDENIFKPVERVAESSRVKVLYSGNMSRKKGFHWLESILERLDSNIDILYTTGLRGGSGLAEHPRLKCLGAIPHEKMPQIYQQADMLLFPTVREGFGLAAAEAMACGLPVVATNCSALPELVIDGKGGYLCSLGDVEGFAIKLNKLANDAVLRQLMGKFNRVRIEKQFTQRNMVDSYRSLFNQLLNE